MNKKFYVGAVICLLVSAFMVVGYFSIMHNDLWGISYISLILGTLSMLLLPLLNIYMLVRFMLKKEKVVFRYLWFIAVAICAAAYLENLAVNDDPAAGEFLLILVPQAVYSVLLLWKDKDGARALDRLV